MHEADAVANEYGEPTIAGGPKGVAFHTASAELPHRARPGGTMTASATATPCPHPLPGLPRWNHAWPAVAQQNRRAGPLAKIRREGRLELVARSVSKPPARGRWGIRRCERSANAKTRGNAWRQVVVSADATYFLRRATRIVIAKPIRVIAPGSGILKNRMSSTTTKDPSIFKANMSF
jgi:hypothetical protein